MIEITQSESSSQKIEIQIKLLTILKVVLVVVGFYFVYKLRSVIFLLFVAGILAALIDPYADWFSKRKVPRSLAVLLIYVVLSGLFILSLTVLIPPMFHQLGEFVKNFSGIWAHMSSTFATVRDLSVQYGVENSIQQGLQSLEDSLTQAVPSAIGTIKGFFEGLAGFFIVLFLSYYMVAEEAEAKRFFRSLAPVKYQPYLIDLIVRVQKKIGQWLRGQLILMVLIGLFTYVGLLILGVDYALMLGVLAGLTEILPYIGPIVGAVPAVIIALTLSPLKAFLVIALYFFIQDIFQNLIAPKVMQQAVGLNPLVTLIAILVGAELGGVLGAALAIPVAAMCAVLFQDIFNKREALSL